jgi:hypothetical protein
MSRALYKMATEYIKSYNNLLASYFVGDRDGECAQWFMDGVASRLANRVQLTSDGHRAYLEAVEGDFGADVDYAQLVKIYGASSESAKGRYSPAECTGTKKKVIEGKPDPKHISTSFIERSNLTVRIHNHRFTRLTNGLSRKLENHPHSVALFAMYYSFAKFIGRFALRQPCKLAPQIAFGMSLIS